MQQPRDGLTLRSLHIVSIHKIIIRKAQSPRKALHQFLRHSLDLPHKAERGVLKSRQGILGEPFPFHVGAELHLITLFVVCYAVGGADLGILLPAGVGGGGEGDFGFDVVGEREEAGGLGEDGVDFGGADAVVDDAEEADVFGGGDEF